MLLAQVQKTACAPERPLADCLRTSRFFFHGLLCVITVFVVMSHSRSQAQSQTRFQPLRPKPAPPGSAGSPVGQRANKPTKSSQPLNKRPANQLHGAQNSSPTKRTTLASTAASRRAKPRVEHQHKQSHAISSLEAPAATSWAVPNEPGIEFISLGQLEHSDGLPDQNQPVGMLYQPLQQATPVSMDSAPRANGSSVQHLELANPDTGPQHWTDGAENDAAGGISDIPRISGGQQTQAPEETTLRSEISTADATMLHHRMTEIENTLKRHANLHKLTDIRCQQMEQRAGFKAQYDAYLKRGTSD